MFGNLLGCLGKSGLAVLRACYRKYHDQKERHPTQSISSGTIDSDFDQKPVALIPNASLLAQTHGGNSTANLLAMGVITETIPSSGSSSYQRKKAACCAKPSCSCISIVADEPPEEERPAALALQEAEPANWRERVKRGIKNLICPPGSWSSCSWFGRKTYHGLRVLVNVNKSISTFFYIFLTLVRGFEGMITYQVESLAAYKTVGILGIADWLIGTWLGSSHTSQLLGMTEVFAATLIAGSAINLPGAVVAASILALTYSVDYQTHFRLLTKVMGHAPPVSAWAIPKHGNAIRESKLKIIIRATLRLLHLASTSLVAGGAFAGFAFFVGASRAIAIPLGVTVFAGSLVVRSLEPLIPAQQPPQYRKQTCLTQTARGFHIATGSALGTLQSFASLILFISTVTDHSIDFYDLRNMYIFFLAAGFGTVAAFDSNRIFSDRIGASERKSHRDAEDYEAEFEAAFNDLRIANTDQVIKNTARIYAIAEEDEPLSPPVPLLALPSPDSKKLKKEGGCTQNCGRFFSVLTVNTETQERAGLAAGSI